MTPLAVLGLYHPIINYTLHHSHSFLSLFLSRFYTFTAALIMPHEVCLKKNNYFHGVVSTRMPGKPKQWYNLSGGSRNT